jgi:hypothetical protein
LPLDAITTRLAAHFTDTGHLDGATDWITEALTQTPTQWWRHALTNKVHRLAEEKKGAITAAVRAELREMLEAGVLMNQHGKEA